MSTATDIETKTCRCCFEAQPVTEFRLKRKNSEDRHGQCRRCFNREMSERRKAMRRRKVCTYVRDVQAVKRDRDRVIVLTRELASRLGGIETIVALFKEVYEEAKAAGRHFTAFRVLKTVLDLSIVTDALSRERISEMSSEDLDAELMRGSISAFQENPHLAVLAAHQLGWTVIPPNENEGVDA